jgi:hypothetical protein
MKKRPAVRMNIALSIVTPWQSYLELRIQTVVGQFAENAEDT